MHTLRSLVSSPRTALALIAVAATLYGCSSSGKPKTATDTGGESGDTGGTGGSTSGTGGKTTSTGGSTGTGGVTSTGGSTETGGSTGTGGSASTGGSTGTGGSGTSDGSVADSSAPAGDGGGYKLDPKSPIVACNGGYNLQGVTPDDFCSYYEMYCMYDPTGMAKNPSGTALPPGTGSWFYKDRADCIMRYSMASTAAKGCRAGQLCKNKAGGCTHATGHFSNCP